MKLKLLVAFTAIACSSLYAQTIEVRNAWVRIAVQGQKSSGAFMTITAKDGAKLVAASSPVAGMAEVHEMKMEDNVMKMRAVPELDLPAGKAVDLRPGGYHVMLMDLKTALKKGSTVPLTLTFRDAKGGESKVDLQVPVGLAPPVVDAHEHGMKH